MPALVRWLKENGHELIDLTKMWSKWADLAFGYQVCLDNWPKDTPLAPGMEGFRWRLDQPQLDNHWRPVAFAYKKQLRDEHYLSEEDLKTLPESIPPMIEFNGWSVGAFVCLCSTRVAF